MHMPMSSTHVCRSNKAIRLSSHIPVCGVSPESQMSLSSPDHSIASRIDKIIRRHQASNVYCGGYGATGIVHRIGRSREGSWGGVGHTAHKPSVNFLWTAHLAAAH